MDQNKAVAALGALAQDTRLGLFRLLVTAGPAGLSAGTIAERLGVAPSSLSFHLQQLLHAGLVTQRRLGRQLIYAAEYGAMNELLACLTESCCGRAASCMPVCNPAQPHTTGERDPAGRRRLRSAFAPSRGCFLLFASLGGCGRCLRLAALRGKLFVLLSATPCLQGVSLLTAALRFSLRLASLGRDPVVFLPAMPLLQGIGLS